ncbi:MAG: DUF72 domain-containing protein [Desulfonatronovibrio sp.]
MDAEKKDIRMRIGTSGWHYEHWIGPFYPSGLKKKDQLKYYSARFNSTEINNTFYQLPGSSTLETWFNSVPEHFVFSLKASRYITHMKKLKDPEKTLPGFLRTVQALGGKAGPVLFQLPPRWRCNHERLRAFLEALPENLPCAFEFRDPSWINDKTLELLKNARASFCIYEIEGFTAPREITADLVYIRLHGPDQAYQGRYDRQTLSGWAGAISSWLEKGHEVHCYFDNDEQGFAALNALELAAMLGLKQGESHA